MDSYREMYLCLFNAITDALRELEGQRVGSAADILKSAQQRAEEMYLSDEISAASPQN